MKRERDGIALGVGQKPPMCGGCESLTNPPGRTSRHSTACNDRYHDRRSLERQRQLEREAGVHADEDMAPEPTSCDDRREHDRPQAEDESRVFKKFKPSERVTVDLDHLEKVVESMKK